MKLTSKNRKGVQRWPMDIPAAMRKPLDSGPQTCGFRRLIPAPGREPFQCQRVRLDLHLLGIVTRGNLLVQKQGSARVVPEGFAALVLPGQTELTEFPDSPGGGVDIQYCMFSARYLRHKFLECGEAEVLAHRVTPLFADIFVLDNFVAQLLPVMQIGGLQFPFNFKSVFNFAFSGVWAAAFMFLKGAFFEKKRALDLYLERHIGDPAAEASAAASYPGGAKALRRDSNLFIGMSPTKWLLRRRMQLAAIWIRHGERTTDEIGGVLGYRTRSSFRRDYRTAHGRDFEDEERNYNLLTMPHAEFVSIVTPFWLVPEEKVTGLLHKGALEAARMTHELGNVKPRRRKMKVEAADRGGDSLPAGGQEDEIPVPTVPRFTVMDSPVGNPENHSNRLPFSELRTTGAEVIFFPRPGLNSDLGSFAA